MAAAKRKPKAKVKRKAPAGKPAIRKKAKPLKKAAARKPAARRPAPKKEPAARQAPKPRPAAIPPTPPRGPLPGEERVGFVTHYYRSEEHTSELQSRLHLVCRLLLEKKKKK